MHECSKHDVLSLALSGSLSGVPARLSRKGGCCCGCCDCGSELCVSPNLAARCCLRAASSASVPTNALLDTAVGLACADGLCPDAPCTPAKVGMAAKAFLLSVS